MTAVTLSNLIARRFGEPHRARLPEASPLLDSTATFDALLADLRGTDVVLFEGIPTGRLDDFFRLRLAQILRGEAALPALSIVVLREALSGRILAGGFKNRFRSSWPFARCAFVTCDAARATQFAEELGLPTAQLNDDHSALVLLESAAAAGQKVGLQIQPIWGRCGSTTAFQNQVENLVQSGLFTIRVFAECDYRRGPTLARRVGRLIPENSADAGAHVNVVAVPCDPLVQSWSDDPDAAWATWLSCNSDCVLDHRAINQAAAEADAVIGNHIACVGLALRLAPKAKLILDVHDDLAAADLQATLLDGGTAQEAEAAARHAERAQAAVLAIPDMCTHVNRSEEQRLGPYSRKSDVVLPRVYVRGGTPETAPRFDVLIVGDKHIFNVRSLRWFLDQVWRPHLEATGITVAVAGRVMAEIDTGKYRSPHLQFFGFVEDLDGLRAACRLSVIPDQGGTGIPVKMLAALAHGHPLSTTTIGMRGFDPAVAALLPACDTPASLAADILQVLRNAESLAERARLVQQVQDALRLGPSYSNCLAALEDVSERRQAERAMQWQSVIAAAARVEPAPFTFTQGVSFPMSGTASDGLVLVTGWHPAEAWGRWMDGPTATVRIDLPQPADSALVLQLSITLPPVPVSLSVSVDDADFEPVEPKPEWNLWELPASLVAGKRHLLVTLRVNATVCPLDASISHDDRVLGIGLRAILVSDWKSPVVPLGKMIALRRDAAPDRIFVAGWHAPEDWGCWSNGPDASLRLAVAEPLAGRFRLDLDLVAPPVPQPLTLCVNGHPCPPRLPSVGRNAWTLPKRSTEGYSGLSLELHMPRAHKPSDLGPSDDDRILGVGVHAIGIFPLDGTSCRLNETIPVCRDMQHGDILQKGWHTLEAWGCWSKAQTATMQLAFDEPLTGPLALELSLTPPLQAQPLTVVVNGIALPQRVVDSGKNNWHLPAESFARQVELRIELKVDHTVRPADIKDSRDDRSLGVGLRSVRVHTVAEPAISAKDTYISELEQRLADRVLDAARIRCFTEAVIRYFVIGDRSPAVATTLEQGRSEVDPDWIPGMLACDGPSEIEFHAFARFRPCGGTILDIGANYGYSASSIWAVGCKAPILSFEPNPAYRACLDRIKSLRPGLYDWCYTALDCETTQRRFVIPVIDGMPIGALASADVEGGLAFAIHELYPQHVRNHMEHSGLLSSAVPQLQFAEAVWQSRPLDDVLGSLAFSVPTDLISAIKIDVESFEWAVIEGARGTLQQHRPLIMIEGANRDERVTRTLTELGFRYAEYSDDGLRLTSKTSSRANGFFVHDSRVEDYRADGMLQG